MYHSRYANSHDLPAASAASLLSTAGLASSSVFTAFDAGLAPSAGSSHFRFLTSAFVESGVVDMLVEESRNVAGNREARKWPNSINNHAMQIAQNMPKCA